MGRRIAHIIFGGGVRVRCSVIAPGLFMQVEGDVLGLTWKPIMIALEADANNTSLSLIAPTDL